MGLCDTFPNSAMCVPQNIYRAVSDSTHAMRGMLNSTFYLPTRTAESFV